MYIIIIYIYRDEIHVLYSPLNVKPHRKPLLHGHSVQVGCHGLMILVILSPCPSVRSPRRCHLFLFVFNLPVVETIQGLHPHSIHKGLLGFPNSMVSLNAIHSFHQICIRSKLGTMIASPGSRTCMSWVVPLIFPWTTGKKGLILQQMSGATAPSQAAHIWHPILQLEAYPGICSRCPKQRNYGFLTYGGHTNGKQQSSNQQIHVSESSPILLMVRFRSS